MRSYSILALAALSSAFVVPNQQVNNLEHVEKQTGRTTSRLLNDLEESFGHASDEIEGAFDRLTNKAHSKYEEYTSKGQHALDDALNFASESEQEAKNRIHDTYFDAQSWVQSAKERLDEAGDLSTLGHGHHHGGHDHHGKPNMTVYQLIASSKYTTRLAKLVNEYDDIVEALNGTSANFTVFAPTDKAFEKIPDDAPKPSKEFLKALLTYHVSPEFYPAGRVLVTRTIPTLLKSPALGKKPLPQRLATEIGFRGLTVNFYSRIVAVDVFGTNGVIHGVDSILLPPPRVLKIIDLLPGEFSTLELGLGKTGLLEKLNSTDHPGGTFFAPSNFAFQKLGPRVNAFLFSSSGLKYLEAILKYHVVPANTLYSDAYYKEDSEDSDMEDAIRGGGLGIPKGVFHVDLPTMLEDRSLNVDVARYGRLIEIKINGFSRVQVPDGVAYDGVVHEIDNVLVPPKQLADGSMDYNTEDLSVEEFKERLSKSIEQRGWWSDL